MIREMYATHQLIAPITTGVLLVDKPTGVSSHAVVNWARRVSGERRVGHAGTLDPLATGLLVVLIGREFTKQQTLFLKQPKAYSWTMMLGFETDTLDSTGSLIATADPELVAQITEQSVIGVLPRFTGNVQQEVPIYSAVKVGGRKLYALARSRKDSSRDSTELPELPQRTVAISRLRLESFVWKDGCATFPDVAQQRTLEVSMQVSCSSGTYVRALARDIGRALGVGAVVTRLRRTEIGELSLTDSTCCPLLYQKAAQ